jgi:branched-chain amino acid transport system ATP-binding protein
MVMGISDTVIALNGGPTVIAEGPPAAIQSHPDVFRAYLGAFRWRRLTRPALLRMENLHAGYGPITALRGLDLVVAPGELVCLIGANGAREDVDLARRSRACFSEPGTHRVRRSRDSRARARGDLARRHRPLPEGRRVFPYLTVEEESGDGRLRAARSRGDRRRRRRGLPALSHPRGSPPPDGRTLSGGEQQMLAIARAHDGPARLVLFDEPRWPGPDHRGTTFGSSRHSPAGTTVLMVEQNAYAALRMADRAYVMETGRIVLEARPPISSRDDHVRRAYLGAGRGVGGGKATGEFIASANHSVLLTRLKREENSLCSRPLRRILA